MKTCTSLLMIVAFHNKYRYHHHPPLIFNLQLESPQPVYQSKLHTLRNPIMYTSPKFESEEAAKSQVDPLQNDQRGFSGSRN